MAKLRVAAVGELAEDCYQDGRCSLGGISVNFARSAAFAGAACALYAPIGDDDRAARVREALRLEAIAPQRVRTLEGKTAAQQIRMGADGERIFSGFEAGVLLDYQLTQAELDELVDYDAIALPCSPESQRVFAQCMAADLDTAIVADFSKDSPMGEPADPVSWIRPHANRLSVAFVGGDTSMTEPLIGLSRETSTLIVLTVGAGGAYGFERGRQIHQPSLAERIVDTTGCGDAFAAGFTVSYIREGDLATALRAGSALAAKVAGKYGAAPSETALGAEG